MDATEANDVNEASDAVFKALADPTRRRMLDRLNERSGQNLMQLCDGLGMARQSVSKHLAVLEAAQLVTTVRSGREKLHYLNAAPIHEIEQRWINRYDRVRVRALTDLKSALEGTAMDNRSFVYTSYINTTPEQLWKGLTDPAFQRRYWGLEQESDWEVGSPITWKQRGATITHPEQVVLECEPFRRLAYTWHELTPEWAAAVGFGEARRVELAAEPRSRVAFDIEPVSQGCKLTVVHEFFVDDSQVISLVREGWPVVISGLKTLLETGQELQRS